MSDFEQIPYADGATALTGLIARPAGTPRAAVVVYPTIMNQQPNVLRRLPMLAAAGYLAFCADLYGRNPADRPDAMALATIRDDPAAYRARIKAAVDAVAGHPAAQGLPLAAIGYCMGGQMALEAARMQLPLRAVASFHGLLAAVAPATAPITARILVCHGDADPLVDRDQVRAFQEEMDGAGADWHLHVYAGVRHGFTDPQSASQNLPMLAYNASADRQSWAATMALFDEVFG